MRHPPGLFWLFLCVLLLAACHAGSHRKASRSVKPGPTLAADESAQPTDGISNGLRGEGFNTFGGQEQGEAKDRSVVRRFSDTNDDGLPDQPERMLVHRGEVRVEVARPDEAMAAFREQVAAWGGHLQSQTDHTLVVRVPTEHFEAAFTWAREAGRLLSESRRAEDVTEEFVDLGIRLDNARKSRDRLLEVLKRADKVEDILKVEAELRRLTEEIERMEGRKKLLADQVAMSTLSATFQAVAEAPPRKTARQPSRFDWINRIGAERVMEDF